MVVCMVVCACAHTWEVEAEGLSNFVSTQHNTAQQSKTQYSTTQHSTAKHKTAQHTKTHPRKQRHSTRARST